LWGFGVLGSNIVTGFFVNLLVQLRIAAGAGGSTNTTLPRSPPPASRISFHDTRLASPLQSKLGRPPFAQSFRRAQVGIQKRVLSYLALRSRISFMFIFLTRLSDKKALAELSQAIQTQPLFATRVSLNLQVRVFAARTPLISLTHRSVCNRR